MSTEPATVRGAVEKAEQAPAKPSLATVVRTAIENQSSSMRQVLPKDHDPERFARLVLTAVKATPKLMECFSTDQGRTSVLLSAMQLATVGLEPNTATQDAWLLPRKNGGVMECEMSIGYRGYLKLARRSGEIKSVYADVVRDKDEFEWSRGLDDTLRHVAYPVDAERGELRYAYAVVRYMNGGHDFVVLGKADVEKRREMSTSYKFAPRSSPWTIWPDEMWKKTALRVLAKTLPLTAEAASTLAGDESRLAMDDDGVIVTTATYADDEPAELMPG